MRLRKLTDAHEQAAQALAARLWKTFGNARQADVVRAEARRAFSEPAKKKSR